MRIDRTFLVGLVLLSQSAALHAQTLASKVADGDPAGQSQSQVLEEPLPERLPTVVPAPPESIPTPAMTPYSPYAPQPGNDSGMSLAQSYVPLPGEKMWQGEGAYQTALESSGWCDEACDAPQCGPWFGSASALIMTRTMGDRRFYSSYENGSPNVSLQNSEQASPGWTAGYEVQIGRRDYDGSAWEVTYWNLGSFDGDHGIRNSATPGQLSTPLDVSLVTFGGVDASDYFNNAHVHRLERYDSAQNLELNYWQAAVPVCDCRLRLNCLAGVRWMQFNDQLVFGSLSGGGGAVPAATHFGDNGGASEAYVNVSSQNNLIGMQLGSHADYTWLSGLSMFCTPRVGLYANCMNQTTRVYTGDGINGLASPLTAAPANYPLDASKVDVALLAQLDIGTKYQFAPHWHASIAYRLVGVTGVALADSQIPSALVNYGAFRDIQSDGVLILQGAVLGLEFNY